MIRQLFPAESVPITYRLFCAADAATFRPKLAVEARTEQEARHRLHKVMEWFGLGRLDNFIVLRLDGAVPRGVPRFLEAFFSAHNLGCGGAGAVPGTSDVH